MVSGSGAAPPHSPAVESRQGAGGSKMWAVVVLGILSAVFAYVWFGGRKGSQSRERAVTAARETESIADTGHEEEEGCPLTQERIPATRAEPAASARAEERVPRHTPQQQPPVLPTRAEPSQSPAPEQRPEKPLHAQQEMTNHAATLEEESASAHSPGTPQMNGDVSDQEDETVCNKETLTEASSSNEEVQEEKVSEEECRSVSEMNGSWSPERVEVSSDSNVESEVSHCHAAQEPSEVEKLLSVLQEPRADSQGDITAMHHASSKEFSNAQKLEEALVSHTTGETSLKEANLEKEDCEWKGTSLADKSSHTSQSEVVLQDGNPQRTKQVAAVQPMSQNVNVGFKVHYITDCDSQIIAVTGNHEKLGGWEAYLPLTHEKDGLWSHSVTLPGDTDVQWKFVMVENGKIKRWEECSNRSLKFAHEENAQQWWGFP